MSDIEAQRLESCLAAHGKFDEAAGDYAEAIIGALEGHPQLPTDDFGSFMTAFVAAVGDNPAVAETGRRTEDAYADLLRVVRGE